MVQLSMVNLQAQDYSTAYSLFSATPYRLN